MPQRQLLGDDTPPDWLTIWAAGTPSAPSSRAASSAVAGTVTGSSDKGVRPTPRAS
jgi:hypothetical protein